MCLLRIGLIRPIDHTVAIAAAVLTPVMEAVHILIPAMADIAHMHLIHPINLMYHHPERAWGHIIVIIHHIHQDMRQQVVQ